MIPKVDDTIMTSSRLKYGLAVMLITSLIGLITAVLTSRSQANEVLNEFKIETAKEIGAVKGNVQTLQAVNADINRRLENIEGNLQTITSYILKK